MLLPCPVRNKLTSITQEENAKKIHNRTNSYRKRIVQQQDIVCSRYQQKCTKLERKDREGTKSAVNAVEQEENDDEQEDEVSLEMRLINKRFNPHRIPD